jgi:hypothetical protein
VEYQYPPHQRKGSYAEEGRSVNFLKVRTVVYFDLAPPLGKYLCLIHRPPSLDICFTHAPPEFYMKFGKINLENQEIFRKTRNSCCVREVVYTICIKVGGLNIDDVSRV